MIEAARARAGGGKAFPRHASDTAKRYRATISSIAPRKRQARGRLSRFCGQWQGLIH